MKERAIKTRTLLPTWIAVTVVVALNTVPSVGASQQEGSSRDGVGLQSPLAAHPSEAPVRTWGRKYSPGPFVAPQDVAFTKTGAWITDPAGNAVVEVDTATGRVVRTVRGEQGRFDTPVPIAASSTNLWVDGDGPTLSNTIAELNASNGKYVRGLRREPPQADAGGDLAVCGAHLWSVGLNGYFEYSVSTGRLERVVDLVKRGYWSGDSLPGDPSVEGNDLWDTSVKGRTIVAVELSCSTSSVLKALRFGSSAEYVGGIAVSGDHLWILSGYTTPTTEVLREFNTATGAFVRLTRFKAVYDIDDGPIAAAGNVLCILSDGGGRLVLVDGSTGSVTKVVSSALLSPEIQYQAAGGGDFWLLDTEGSTVDVLSAKTGRILHYLGPSSGPGCVSRFGCGG